MAQHVARHVAEQVAELVAEHLAGKAAAHPQRSHRPRHASSLVVYTALLDDKQPLREVPIAAESSADFVCLTTDASLRSDTWQVVPV